MTEELSREDVRAAIDRLVQELLAAAQVQGPSVDAIALAQKHLGMALYLDHSQQQRGRAQRVQGKKQIFLRPEPREERHQWTVAHEIGEHFKAEMLGRLGITPEQTRPMTGESLANLFAQLLLVPSAALAEQAPNTGYDLLELKRLFPTASHEIIAFRLLDLPEPCIITVIDNDQIHRRRSNAWRVRKQLSAPELKCQHYVSQNNRPHFLHEQGWTVQGWPIHQTDWKREILRSVVDEDSAMVT